MSRILNIAIHALNAVLAGRVAQLAARLGDSPQPSAFAAMTALAWAAFPIHATTVLYPIQRMTLLGATGSLVVFALILGKWTRRRMLLAALAYVLAICAKENAILAMPAAFVLRGLLGTSARSRHLLYRCLAMVSAAFIAIVILFNVQLETPLRYSAWDFSLMDRMMLAPRIILEYAANVLLPMPNGFSFYHDDYMATTARPLPPIYLASLVAAPVGFLVLSYLANHNRMAAAGIAVFILLHTAESTAIALDLYFEHRNYLPSFGLAFMLAAFWARPDTSLGRKKWIVTSIYLLCLVGVLGYRAKIIGSETELTRHHLATHPSSFRTIADTAYFGIDVPSEVTRAFPYPIELHAISLRSTCSGMPPPFELQRPIDDGPAPKRSLRLHADTLKLCANPCVIPDTYLYRLGNRYLLDERVDSYRTRIDRQLTQVRLKRRELGCQ